MPESNFTKGSYDEMTEKAFRVRIAVWLEATPFKEFYDYMRNEIYGQDDVLADACLGVYLYLEKIAKGKHNKDAFIITAPSGNGKSYFYTVLRDYFARNLSFLPIYQVDCSNLTEAGYKGAEPLSVTEGLMENPALNGIGIVFLDEVDKKLFPSYDSNGSNSNSKVQQGLLTCIEGCIIKDTEQKKIRTDNTLFIGLGAFTDIRENKVRNQKHKLGFSCDAEETVTHYADITREDLIDCGGCYEFVGRFSSIINFHPLSEEAVRSIIKKIAKEEGVSLGIEIRIEEDTILELIKESNSKFGCRLLRSIIHNRAMAMYKIIKLNDEYSDARSITLSENGDCVNTPILRYRHSSNVCIS